ncbi:MAG: alpha/beta fold hydrolase [Actinomycetota bacterium]
MGVSYGTYLGTLYAQYFPENVGRIVLDGAIDPNATGTEQNLTQAIGFDTALKAFVDDCFLKSDCPLQKPRSKALSQIISLFQGAATKPLRGYPNRPATESLLVLGTASALYDSATGWPQLRDAIREGALRNRQTISRFV